MSICFVGMGGWSTYAVEGRGDVNLFEGEGQEVDI